MGRLLDIQEINEFSRITQVPDSAITSEILAAVAQLHEIEELEPFIREILYDPTEILYDPTETHHGPTEIADILTSHIHVRGHKKLAAFVLKGRSFKKVHSKDVSHQFMKLRTIPALGVMVFGATGHIQDDAQRDFFRTALDAETDYLIINQHQCARLLIAYEKICPQDGTPFEVSGVCANGHVFDDGISLQMTVREKIHYTINRLQDTSHPGAKRYSAFLIVDRHYSKDLIKDLVREATEKIKNMAYYRNERTKAKWGTYPAQVVWLHVGYDVNDLVNCNWVCTTIWIDPALDEQMRPLPLNSNDNVNDIDIYWNSQYEFMKDFNEEHQVGKDDYLEKLNEIRTPFIQLAEKAIEFFSQYQQSSKKQL